MDGLVDGSGGQTMTMRACQTLVVAACLLCGGVAHAQVATVPVQRHGHRLGGRRARRRDRGRDQCGDQRRVEGDDDRRRRLRHSVPGQRALPDPRDGGRVPAGRGQRCHASRGADADARLQARRRCHHRSADRHGAGDRDQHRGDRALRLDQGVPDVADRRRRRAAADPAVHLFEPARNHRGNVRRGDQRRPQLLARNPHRRHAARPQPAGRQQQRDVAADRSASRSSSSRPARSAPSSAARRRRSRTSSSSPGRTSSTGRARCT